jgi:TPR repeat protein
MTNEEDSKNKAGLVHSRAAALSRAGAASLASRGMQDLLTREDADQWYKRGLDLWDQESYEEAFQCFERGIAVNPNHVGLQYCLGCAYLHGEGVMQDFSQAATWFRRAADPGDADAQFALGRTYQYGLRHDDYSIAAAWYLLAAEQGHSGAAFELGSLYETGQGVGQDHAHAAAYYRQAAERGHERARQALDDMRRKGHTVQDEATDKSPLGGIFS